ncbi:Coenzyme F420 hydrogenase/dehydrogenase, beta subunit C-terminal domain [Anaerocolumna aminovalerica]|uniref:Coenzyme F420 hydrogenase/dehydrogenase, beta subunit C-terminal domain n=1 Tax=Anaerocolumna aminovalerica TaxID=1527 RepID=UPI00248C19AE|nr:Coenzyme F420 hydrogenase/dehydrogenase, beta subunit C-terminal domain [Anaerocolumna aminovalerica]
MIEINQKEACCGCEACYNACPMQCIQMKYDAEGFKYPFVNKDTCINCGKCKKACPIINKKSIQYELEECYAAFNDNLTERLNCSSGGIFSLLASAVLSTGGVVVGTGMSDDCRSTEHVIVNNLSELKTIYGSKYLQSNINDIFKKIKQQLEKGNVVLFSGTPCQVAGLQNYLVKPYDNLLCIDVICHGVPSPGLWKKNVDYIEKKIHSKLVSVNFRCKKYGGHSEYGIAYKNDKQKKAHYSSKEEDPYIQMFLNDLSLRPSCYNCKFKGIHRNSDITLGDFWGIDDFAKRLNDGYGVSVVVVHSNKGKNLFEQIIPYIQNERVDVKKVFESHNGEMTKSVVRPDIRESFWKDYQMNDFAKLSKKYVKIPLKKRIKKTLRRIGILEKVQKMRGGNK